MAFLLFYRATIIYVLMFYKKLWYLIFSTVLRYTEQLNNYLCVLLFKELPMHL